VVYKCNTYINIELTNQKIKKIQNLSQLFEIQVLAKEKNLKQRWKKKMINQVYKLPKFDEFFRKAKRHFKL